MGGDFGVSFSDVVVGEIGGCVGCWMGFRKVMTPFFPHSLH